MSFTAGWLAGWLAGSLPVLFLLAVSIPPNPSRHSTHLSTLPAPSIFSSLSPILFHHHITTIICTLSPASSLHLSTRSLFLTLSASFFLQHPLRTTHLSALSSSFYLDLLADSAECCPLSSTETHLPPTLHPTGALRSQRKHLQSPPGAKPTRGAKASLAPVSDPINLRSEVQQQQQRSSPLLLLHLASKAYCLAVDDEWFCPSFLIERWCTLQTSSALALPNSNSSSFHRIGICDRATAPLITTSTGPFDELALFHADHHRALALFD